jgi:hypothetical protein
MRPAYDRWCHSCETFTLGVVASKLGKLGRARTRRCLNCKREKRTLETLMVPGLRRAIRKLRKAHGEQLSLPL